MDNATVEILVRGLLALGKENDYVEFKMNDANPIDLGERICGLSNAAALAGKPFAYLVWGVEDSTRTIVGTDLSFKNWKKGGEDIVPYWRISLLPHIELFDYELEIDSKRVLVLEISAASYSPTQFRNIAYCRVDSYTKPLRDFPTSEKRLFDILNERTAEKRICYRGANKEDLRLLLNFKAYFEHLGRIMPSNEDEAIRCFVQEGFLAENRLDSYDITNLGALLYANSLSKFQSLQEKAIRIVFYDGNDRLQTKGRESFDEGYAICFEKAIRALLPRIANPDIFVNGIRKDSYSIPTIALREALANATMHQDLLSGYGPLIEVFDNRVEWSNPGSLHVAIDRIIDTVPLPENPQLAMFLRRINVGDASGSGVDKICLSLEKEKMAPPIFESTPTGTRVVIFRNKRFADMDAEEKLLATYDHAVLKHLDREYMTNASLRERFGLNENSVYVIARLLSNALERGLIKKREGSTKKDTSYMPYWA